MSQPTEANFDVRTLQHKLRRGEVTHEQVRTFLSSLPDDAAQAKQCETRFVNVFERKQADDEDGDEG